MSDVTVLLMRWSSGDRDAFAELVPIVYQELRRLARHHLSHERTGVTLQPTALVHEAYLRLVDQNHMQWNGHAHFFGAAAEVMRRVLVDRARERNAQKRGSGLAAERLDVALGVSGRTQSFEVLALDQALQKLSKIDPERVRVIELRYFGGLSVKEAAVVLGVSEATVKRDWALGRAWLFRQMGGTESAPPPDQES